MENIPLIMYKSWMSIPFDSCKYTLSDACSRIDRKTRSKERAERSRMSCKKTHFLFEIPSNHFTHIDVDNMADDRVYCHYIREQDARVALFI